MAYPFDVATFNLISFSQKMPDLTDSTPKMVELPVMNEDGSITTKQVQNLGMMKSSLQSVLESAANNNIYSFYVDQANGADTNPGTSDAPFKSLTKAFQMIKPFSYVGIVIIGDYDTSSDANSYSRHNLIGVSLNITPKGTLKIPFYQYNNLNVLTFTINSIYSNIQIYIESGFEGKIEIGTEGYDTDLSLYNGAFIINEISSTSINLIIRDREDDNHMLIVGENSSVIKNAAILNMVLSYAYAGTNREIIVDNALIQNGLGLLYLKCAGVPPIINSAGDTLSLKDIITGLTTDANGVPLNYMVTPTNALD